MSRGVVKRFMGITGEPQGDGGPGEGHAVNKVAVPRDLRMHMYKGICRARHAQAHYRAK